MRAVSEVMLRVFGALTLALGPHLPALPPPLHLTAAAHAEPTLGARLPIEGAEHLSRLFTGLEARLRGEGRVRVTHIGDSHIVADLWTGSMRERWQRQFGDGGRGFVLPGRAWRSFGQRHVVQRSEGEWEVFTVKRERLEGSFGPGGCLFVSADPRDSLEVFTRPGVPASAFDTLTVFTLGGPLGGPFTLEVDDLPYGRLSAERHRTELVSHTFQLTDAPHSVRLSPGRGGAPTRVFGFSLERSAGGLIYDSIGLNGAHAKQLLKNSAEGLEASVAPLRPTVVILSYGINELFDHTWTHDEYLSELNATLSALREAAPEADCLLTGTFSALRGGAPLRKHDALYAAQRAAAALHRCAFWDARAAMGEDLRPWQRAGLAQRDGVHLSHRGYERVAELFDDSFRLSFERWRAARPPQPLAPPPR
jgi:lysophospholipase L1-like esterase